MIEVINKEEKSILVYQMDEVIVESQMIETIKKPQVIHMYAYDIHLLSSRMNIPTLMHYIERFKIDYLALNIPLTKYIKTSQYFIDLLKQRNRNLIIICTGEAITTQISKDMGADGFTSDGRDLIRVIEQIEEKRRV